MKRLFALALLVGLLVGCASDPVPVGNTVRVDAEVGFGSAVIVSVSETCDILALTARHVADLGSLTVLGVAAHAQKHESADLAVLQFSLPTCKGMRGVKVAAGREGVGVYATGFTVGGAMSVQRGLFYATSATDPAEVVMPVASYYGMSGGGVYLETGELVGLVVGGWPNFPLMSRVVLLTPEVLKGVGLDLLDGLAAESLEATVERLAIDLSALQKEVERIIRSAL